MFFSKDLIEINGYNDFEGGEDLVSDNDLVK
ncbi:hypothetical protein J2W95_002794 [Flavobacterium granuli]|uniref:Uncharacterized protein n=1 Tax=Flavobacterium granuli TaxID=280093 RepID=A0ABU1S4X1_9FLAO|nr:hypothetical protein [Flavobacterium granuli]